MRPRLAALGGVTSRRRFDPPTTLRLRQLGEYHAEIAKLDAEDKAITRELRTLVHASGTGFGRSELVTRAVAAFASEPL